MGPSRTSDPMSSLEWKFSSVAKVKSRRWWWWEVGGENGGTGVDAAEDVVIIVGGRGEVGVEEG